MPATPPLSDFEISERAASAASILEDAVVKEALGLLHSAYLNDLMLAEVGSSKAATAHAKLQVLVDFKESLRSMITDKKMRDNQRKSLMPDPDTIDEAAKAFDADIKGEREPAPKPSKAPREIKEGPPERLFPNVGELEEDEESPRKGGGDDDERLYDVRDKDEPDEEEEEDPDAEKEPGEEDEEDEDAAANAEFLSQQVPVTVDGEAQTVTLKEALEGYVRTATFHKRMNEVEEAKKIIHRTAHDAVQNYEYSMGVAKEIHAYLEALVPPAPNWDEEFKKDPIRAREVQKYYEQVEGFKQDMQKKLNDAQTKRQESDAVQLHAFVETESRRFDQMNNKNWAADPKKKVKDLQAMRRTALSQGFSEEELSQVYDSRMLQVLLKASKYDRMMASRPKPVRQQESQPKTVRTGSGPARRKRSFSEYTNAVKTLNKTGRLDDAAVVFDQIIKREG